MKKEKLAYAFLAMILPFARNLSADTLPCAVGEIDMGSMLPQNQEAIVYEQLINPINCSSLINLLKVEVSRVSEVTGNYVLLDTKAVIVFLSDGHSRTQILRLKPGEYPTGSYMITITHGDPANDQTLGFFQQKIYFAWGKVVPTTFYRSPISRESMGIFQPSGIIVDGEAYIPGFVGRGPVVSGYAYQIHNDWVELLPVSVIQLAMGDRPSSWEQCSGFCANWIEVLMPPNSLEPGLPVYLGMFSPDVSTTVLGLMYDPTVPASDGLAGFFN